MQTSPRLSYVKLTEDDMQKRPEIKAYLEAEIAKALVKQKEEEVERNKPKFLPNGDPDPNDPKS